MTNGVFARVPRFQHVGFELSGPFQARELILLDSLTAISKSKTPFGI